MLNILKRLQVNYNNVKNNAHQVSIINKQII